MKMPNENFIAKIFSINISQFSHYLKKWSKQTPLKEIIRKYILLSLNSFIVKLKSESMFIYLLCILCANAEIVVIKTRMLQRLIDIGSSCMKISLKLNTNKALR